MAQNNNFPILLLLELLLKLYSFEEWTLLLNIESKDHDMIAEKSGGLKLKTTNPGYCKLSIEY